MTLNWAGKRSAELLILLCKTSYFVTICVFNNNAYTAVLYVFGVVMVVDKFLVDVNAVRVEIIKWL